jgi:hypothetical protein
MSVKLFLLKSGENVIADGKELFSGETSCGYVFENPLKVIINSSVFVSNDNEPEVSVSLSPWIILSEEKNVHIPLDWVVTIVEPIESIKEMYERQVNGKDDKDSSFN